MENVPAIAPAAVVVLLLLAWKIRSHQADKDPEATA